MLLLWFARRLTLRFDPRHAGPSLILWRRAI
jgi:hypothetical protein